MRVRSPAAGGSVAGGRQGGRSAGRARSKELKDEAKKLGDKAKDKSLAKEDAAKLQAEAKALNDKAQALEALGKRLKATEIHAAGKAAFASVDQPARHAGVEAVSAAGRRASR